jgi:hypothetical protein
MRFSLCKAARILARQAKPAANHVDSSHERRLRRHGPEAADADQHQRGEQADHE